MFKDNERAQIALYDCVFAVFIFVIVFAAFSSVHDQNFETGSRINNLNEMKHLAHNAMETLIGFEGEPSDWGIGDVEVIGLAEEKYVLDADKVSLLNSMEYDKVKSLLLFGRYDFLIEIEPEADLYGFSIGREITDEVTVIVLERKVFYGGDLANVRLSIFE